MNNLSIVIPSRNLSNLTQCVRAVRQAGETCRIIVVDDGLDGWCDGLDGWCDGCLYMEGVKPFCFSRNVNIGIRAAERDDVLLLNDDALLITPLGFALLRRAAEQYPEFGVIAATTNNAGNTNQLPRGIGLREDPRMVCFVCVLIPRRTLDLVGTLDEEFTGYGYEDDSYCLRVRNAGLKIGIHDGCFVDHWILPSSFRSGSYPAHLFMRNAEIFKQKWGMDNHGRPVK